MVLLVPNGSQVVTRRGRDHTSAVETLLSDDSLQAATVAFLETRTPATVPAFVKHVQVLQGEYAVVQLANEADGDDVVVSSDDATTCLVAVVRCTVTRVVAVMHVDEATARDGSAIRDVMSRVGPQPDLFVAGAYEDEAGAGARVAEAFLSHMDAAVSARVTVRLACIGRANTDASGLPLTQCLRYDCGSASASCASCDAAVPMAAMRSGLRWARAFAGESVGLESVYDGDACGLRLPRREIALPWYCVEKMRSIAALPDAAMLQTWSTSPEAEKASFCDDVRSALGWCVAQWDTGVIRSPATMVVFDARSRAWRAQTVVERIVATRGVVTGAGPVPAASGSPA